MESPLGTPLLAEMRFHTNLSLRKLSRVFMLPCRLTLQRKLVLVHIVSTHSALRTIRTLYNLQKSMVASSQQRRLILIIILYRFDNIHKLYFIGSRISSTLKNVNKNNFKVLKINRVFYICRWFLIYWVVPEVIVDYLLQIKHNFLNPRNKIQSMIYFRFCSMTFRERHEYAFL